MIRRCKPKQDENGRYLKNGQKAKTALNALIRDCSWGNLRLKIESVATRYGLIVVAVPPNRTSQECPKCHHISRENRDGEKFICVECGFVADADNNAGVNIGFKGLKILGVSLSKLLVVHQKVTPKPEVSGSTRNGREILDSLESEPRNPRQLSLFEWRNGKGISC